MPLIACVPNISEGRNEEAIAELGEAVSSVRGVRLLDVTSDAEHNRTVFTFVGRQSPLRKAVDAMVGVAIQSIDVSRHKGLHPRIGAVDVIPFVPLNDTPMEKAIALANDTGKLLAEHYNLAVYMYDFAAKSEDRRSIARIREGEFEHFHEKIERPEWKPDFGPARVHATAGVTAVGARYPLVAFNAMIATEDISILEQIVHAVGHVHFDRELVKTRVLQTRDYAGYKIAVTILNYKAAMVCTVVDAIIKECESHGVSYDGTELVGLVTGDALFDCLEKSLRLKNFNPLQILDFHVPRKIRI